MSRPAGPHMIYDMIISYPSERAIPTRPHNKRSAPTQQFPSSTVIRLSLWLLVARTSARVFQSGLPHDVAPSSLTHQTDERPKGFGSIQKCGCMEEAWCRFDRVHCHDVVLRNSMIGGLAMNDHGDRALELFQRMLENGFVPNQSTFVAALCACTHTRSSGPREEKIPVDAAARGRARATQRALWVPSRSSWARRTR